MRYAAFLPSELICFLATGETSMKIDLGAKEVAVNHISSVIIIGSYTAKICFIFGNAIQVWCCPSKIGAAPDYGSMFYFDGTPAELSQLVRRLKSEA